MAPLHHFIKKSLLVASNPQIMVGVINMKRSVEHSKYWPGMLPNHIFSIYLLILIAGPQPNKIWLVSAQQDTFNKVSNPSSPSQSYSNGKTFVWKPSVKLHDRDNWLNGDIACDGDNLKLDRNNNLVTIMVEQNVKADVIELPSDGVVFFGAEKVVLGEAGRWQCNKRKSSEAVYFRSLDAYPNFYHGGSWQILSRPPSLINEDSTDKGREISRPRLDTELVPGQWGLKCVAKD